MPKDATGEIALKAAAKRIAIDFCSIPFHTIENSAGVLFDGEHFAYGIQDPNDRIAFLKGLQLGDSCIVDGQDYFPLSILNQQRDKQLNLSIKCSEQRQALADCLHFAKSENPTQTVYQALASAISQPTYARENPILKAMLTGQSAEALYHGHAMSEVHYNLYVEAIYDVTMKKITEGLLPNNLDPLTIISDHHLQEEILNGIDLDSLYQATQSKADNREEIAQAEAYNEQIQAYTKALNTLRDWHGAHDSNGCSTNPDNFLEQTRSPELLSYVLTLINQVEYLYAERKAPIEHLIAALQSTHLYMLDAADHEEYHALALTLYGSPSPTLRGLGAIMMLITIAVIILSIVFVPALAVVVGTTLTAGLIAAGAGTVCAAASAGFFAAGRQTGLSLAMYNVDEALKDDEKKINQP